MAIGTPTLIGHAAGPGSTSVPITTTAAVAAGDKIIAMCQGNFASGGSEHITGVADPEGNSYVTDCSTNSGNNAGVSIASGDSVAGFASGSTVTVTLDRSMSGTGNVWLYKVSGLAAGHAITTAVAHGSGGTTPDSGASAAVSDDVLNIAVVAWNENTTTVSAGTGYSKLDESVGTKTGMTEYQIATGQASATQDATASQGTASPVWSICLAVYQGASAGPATVDLDLGAVPSPAAVHGPDLAATRGIFLGALTGGSVHGLDLSSVLALTLGHVPGSAAVHGADLSLGIGLVLGTIPSGAAAHGVDLSATRALTLGALTGGSPYGADVTIVTLLDIGHIPSSAAAHGPDLARSTPLGLGHIVSPGVVHGPGLAATRSLAVAHIASAAAARGVDLSAVRALRLAHVPSRAEAYGLDLALAVTPTLLLLVHLLDADALVDVLSDAIRVHCYDNSVMADVFDPELLAQLATPTLRVTL